MGMKFSSNMGCGVADAVSSNCWEGVNSCCGEKRVYREPVDEPKSLETLASIRDRGRSSIGVS